MLRRVLRRAVGSANLDNYSTRVGWRRITHFAVAGGLGAGSAFCFSAVTATCSAPPAYHGKYVPVHADDHSLPVIPLLEVQKRRHADSIWVTYEGYVYDVTAFVHNHPGGKELLLTCGGMDLKHFFENYTVHRKSDKAAKYLQSMRIGRLSADDALKAEQSSNADTHVANRFRVLGSARARLCVVLACAPVFTLLRVLIQIIGFVIPPLARFLAAPMPFSVPGVGEAAKLPVTNSLTGKKSKIAVIGGGIAGTGCAYALARQGYDVTLYEAREHLSGNARTFEWGNVNGKKVRTCVSVTAWVPWLYKNYDALLKQLDVKTAPIHLSWVLNSKVPGHEGVFWGADPAKPSGSLRNHFSEDFRRYEKVIWWADAITKTFTLKWGKEPSMYSIQSGLGPLNPLATMPLHHLCRLFGVSQDWWDIVFTPYYTASFLTDKLDNMVAVVGPVIESTIPLLPKDGINTTPGENGMRRITTCETWANAGEGIREVFAKMTKHVDVKVNTRVLKVHKDSETKKLSLTDEHGGGGEYDRVVFACPANAVGNINEDHNWVADAVLASPEYADDHHPACGHMHAVMHNDASIIPLEMREEVLRRGSNYVEITKKADGTLNIENTYNFGVQTPEAVVLPLSQKPPMLITHALGEGKTIDPSLIRGTGNHARAHPLYSGWNVAALLMLRYAQGKDGIFYCANYTTPGNCHDMSLLSGLIAAHAIGAAYPFEEVKGAKADFGYLRTLMGI